MGELCLSRLPLCAWPAAQLAMGDLEVLAMDAAIVGFYLALAIAWMGHFLLAHRRARGHFKEFPLAHMRGRDKRRLA